MEEEEEEETWGGGKAESTGVSDRGNAIESDECWGVLHIFIQKEVEKLAKSRGKTRKRSFD